MKIYWRKQPTTQHTFDGDSLANTDKEKHVFSTNYEKNITRKAWRNMSTVLHTYLLMWQVHNSVIPVAKELTTVHHLTQWHEYIISLFIVHTLFLKKTEDFHLNITKRISSMWLHLMYTTQMLTIYKKIRETQEICPQDSKQTYVCFNSGLLTCVSPKEEQCLRLTTLSVSTTEYLNWYRDQKKAHETRKLCLPLTLSPTVTRCVWSLES